MCVCLRIRNWRQQRSHEKFSPVCAHWLCACPHHHCCACCLLLRQHLLVLGELQTTFHQVYYYSSLDIFFSEIMWLKLHTPLCHDMFADYVFRGYYVHECLFRRLLEVEIKSATLSLPGAVSHLSQVRALWATIQVRQSVFTNAHPKEGS